MKIVVLYGDDVAKSRERFFSIISGVKKKGWEVVDIIPETKFSLADKLVATSLFPGEVLYMIDNLKKISEKELSWLSKNSDKYDGSLLVYSDAPLSATLKKYFPKSTVFESFDVPKILFTFLDAFYPNNSKRVLEMFENLLGVTPLELVIAMLGRHLRDLYWALEGGKGMAAQAWRISKLKAQAGKFTKEMLRDTIDTLADIDFKGKTSDVDTRFLLELMIIEKLG